MMEEPIYKQTRYQPDVEALDTLSAVFAAENWAARVPESGVCFGGVERFTADDLRATIALLEERGYAGAGSDLTDIPLLANTLRYCGSASPSGSPADGAEQALKLAHAIYIELSRIDSLAFSADVAKAASALAEFMSRRVRHEEAKLYASQAVGVYERIAGVADAVIGHDLQEALLDYADVLSAAGEHGRAVEEAQRAADMACAQGDEREADSRIFGETSALSRLGRVQAAAGCFDDADASFRRALALLDEEFATRGYLNRLQLSYVCGDYAQVLLGQGRVREASLYLQAARNHDDRAERMHGEGGGDDE